MRKIKYVLLSALLSTCGLFTSCKKAGIIMVIGVNFNEEFNEIDILIDALNNRNHEVIDNINFYTGSIGNKNVVIAETPIGMSEAAMTTTIGIKRFNPKYIISEGSAGGHHSSLKINDLILGEEALDMASYKGVGSDPSTWVLQHDPLKSDQKLLEIANKVNYEYGDKITHGVIASSDCWNTDADFINKIHTEFGEDCEEMETYSILNVCKYFNVPALAIRVISNNITISQEEFDKEAGKNSQRYTIDVIKAI